MTHCRCHCRACGSHFTSLEAFDAHHQGSGSTLIPCAFPDEAPLVEITGGTCTIRDPDRPETDALVYSTERAQKAASYFRGHRRTRERAGRGLRGACAMTPRRPKKPDRPVQGTPTIYFPEDIADLFGMHRETVLRKCRSGEWPHRRLSPQTIVFTDDDLAALLEESRAGRVGGARQP